MLGWVHISTEPSRGVRLVVKCENGWWGVAKLTVHGWRKDDGTILPSPVEFWMVVQ